MLLFFVDLVLIQRFALKSNRFFNWFGMGLPRFFIVFCFLVFICILNILYFSVFNGPYVKPWVRIHELIYPSISNNKAIWALPSDDGEKMGVKYILVRDLVGDNRTKELSTYLKRIKVLEDYFSGVGVRVEGAKIMVFSMWDASIYMQLKAPSALNITNAHHAGIGNQFPHILGRVKEHAADWIIFDTDKMFSIGSGEVSYIAVLAEIKQNYKHVATLPVGKSYYGGWNDASLLIFRKE